MSPALEARRGAGTVDATLKNNVYGRYLLHLADDALPWQEGVS